MADNNHNRKFKIPRNYYAEGFDFCSKTAVSFKPGLTVLVGCNGSGKTTLLRIIKDDLIESDTPHIAFDNLHEGGSNQVSKQGFYGNFDYVANAFCSSEGENIILCMGQIASQIGTFIRKNPSVPELWIILDAVDSGLSIDNINELKTHLFQLILEDNRNRDVYIVVAANAYELAAGEECFDVQHGKYISFKNYDDYRAFILKSREIKNAR